MTDTDGASAMESIHGYRGKRLLDVVGATLLLALLLPLLVVIAVLVRIDSPGPVLFRQPRAGRRDPCGGRVPPFEVLKFRSMEAGADSTFHELRVRAFVTCGGGGADDGGPESGPRYKSARDPRVTRLGRLLRRTSLDELPQLLNVLRGEMSLVGPRPVPFYELAHYDEVALGRLDARPGITGPWQVCGRCDTGYRDMVRMDLEYVQKQSLVGDLRLLLQTVPAVLSGKGAA